MAKILALINQLSQNKFSDNYYKIKKTEMIFMTIFGWIPIQQKREKTTSMKMFDSCVHSRASCGLNDPTRNKTTKPKLFNIASRSTMLP